MQNCSHVNPYVKWNNCNNEKAHSEGNRQGCEVLSPLGRCRDRATLRLDRGTQAAAGISASLHKIVTCLRCPRTDLAREAKETIVGPTPCSHCWNTKATSRDPLACYRPGTGVPGVRRARMGCGKPQLLLPYLFKNANGFP